MTSRVSDRDWLLGVLSDGRAHSLAEILARSMDERGCGLTVHSRVAELRRPEHGGHVIVHERMPGAERGRAHLYRLVSLALPEASTEASSAAPVVDSGDASERPFAQSGPDADDGHPATLPGSSVAAGDDASDRLPSHGEIAGPDCEDGQLSLIAPPARGAYDREAA